MSGIKRHFITVITSITLLLLAASLLCSIPAAYADPQVFAVTSEELFAQAESIMQEIDALQTTINEETRHYDEALSEHNTALEKANKAQARIEEEQEKINFYKGELSQLVTEMYKTKDSTSFLDVVLESADIDDFLTRWDSISAISEQEASLVRGAKTAKANQEQAKKEYDKQKDIAASKMDEASKAQLKVEEKQAELRKEAEKITKEAAEVQAQEELLREAARQAAIAAEAIREAEERARQAAEEAAAADPDADTAEEISLDPRDFYEGQEVVVSSGVLAHPLPSGYYSSGFGYRDLDGGSFHQGLDLAAPEGTPYYAAAAGTVIYATNDGGYNGGAGNWVVIAHGDGLVTKYMHSSKVFVEPGDVVQRGQTIGEVGNTGYSYGAHLHFQVEYNGTAVDPTAFI